MDRALKNKIVATVQPVFMSPMIDQLTVFGQMTALKILQHLFISYGAIDKINHKGKAVKMMGSFNPAKPLAYLIDKLEKGR